MPYRDTRAVGGLETGYAAKCRGLSDRATCIGARC